VRRGSSQRATCSSTSWTHSPKPSARYVTPLPVALSRAKPVYSRSACLVTRSRQPQIQVSRRRNPPFPYLTLPRLESSSPDSAGRGGLVGRQAASVRRRSGDGRWAADSEARRERLATLAPSGSDDTDRQRPAQDKRRPEGTSVWRGGCGRTSLLRLSGNESPIDLSLRPSHRWEQAPCCESVSVAPSG
jgi:hypothetical protein